MRLGGVRMMWGWMMQQGKVWNRKEAGGDDDVGVNSGWRRERSEEVKGG